MNELEGRISYIDDEPDDSPSKTTEKVSERSEGVSKKLIIEENNNLKKFVSYLISHLSKYEDVISYDNFVMKLKERSIDIDIIKSEENEECKVSSEEEFQEVVSKIGEGITPGPKSFTLRLTRILTFSGVVCIEQQSKMISSAFGKVIFLMFRHEWKHLLLILIDFPMNSKDSVFSIFTNENELIFSKDGGKTSVFWALLLIDLSDELDSNLIVFKCW